MALNIGTPAPAPGQTTNRREASVKPSKVVTKLPPAERRWADNVMRVMKIPSKGSQARLMAGAVANAEMLRVNNSPDAVQGAQLRDTVLAAGTPPWKDARRAMAAGAAKVQLDLLSIAPGQRQLKPLAGGGNVNQAYWVERVDADGQTRQSFLAKTPNADPNSQPMGVPLGGEVAREALSGRAAQAFARQTGLDIGMPESHVVALDTDVLPLTQRPPVRGNVTCSVQEARESVKDMKAMGSMDKLGVDRDQVAALAIFDTMTLNTDRHSGNVLIAPDGSLIPIDHGASLVDPVTPNGGNGNGRDRISETMGGPQNALLRVPASHEQMSPKLLKKLAALDPDKFARGLREDRDAIEGEHPDMAGMVSDAAIEASRRSTAFVKLAVKNKPPLTPAAIQAALGGAAQTLLDPTIDDKTFRTRANEVIARYAPNQEVVKQICLASDGEYSALRAQLKELGWRVQGRGQGQVTGGMTDPVLMLNLLAQDLKGPGNGGNRGNIKVANDNALPPAQALAKLLEIKEKAVRDLAALAGPGAVGRLRQELITMMGSPADVRSHRLSLLMEGLTREALDALTQRLAGLVARHNLPATDRFRADVETMIAARDPMEAEAQIRALIAQHGP